MRRCLARVAQRVEEVPQHVGDGGAAIDQLSQGWRQDEWFRDCGIAGLRRQCILCVRDRSLSSHPKLLPCRAVDRVDAKASEAKKSKALPAKPASPRVSGHSVVASRTNSMPGAKAAVFLFHCRQRSKRRRPRKGPPRRGCQAEFLQALEIAERAVKQKLDEA